MRIHRHRARTLFRAALVVLAALALGACSARSPRYRGYQSGYSSGQQYVGSGGYAGGTTYTGGGGAPAATNAVAMVQNADRVLRSQGYQPLGNVLQQSIPTRGIVAFPIMARPGVCYAVFAVGDVGVNDVDLEVVSPSGSPVGADRNTDIHPHVEFCAIEPGMHLARVTMYSGAGNVLYGAYQGPSGSSPNLVMAFAGGGGSTMAAMPGTPDATTSARIQAFRSQMMAAGYQDIFAPRAERIAPGQTESLPATLPAGACYTFATFGGPGVNDSDIFLTDASGSRQIASDASTAVDAQIRDFCPPVTGQYQIRPRLYSGNGVVWFVAMQRAMNAGTAQVTQTPLTASIRQSVGAGGVDASWNQFARELVSVGYSAPASPVSGALTQSAEAPQPVDLQAGSCYAIAAVGDSTVRDLDLSLTDPTGTEIDRDYAQDATPIVRVCPQTSGQYTVRVRMFAGQGQWKMGVFRWEGGTSGAGMQGLMFVRNAEVTRILQGDGYQGDPDFELFRTRLAEGHATTRNVSLRAGVCYAFVAVGGGGLSDVNITVNQGRQVLAQGSQLTASPAVRFCPANAGQYQVPIRAVHGSGDIVFRVFRRQAPGGA